MNDHARALDTYDDDEEEGRAAQDEYYWRIEHEGECPEDKAILVPTWPGSHRLMTLHVCEECEHLYTGND